MKTFLAIDQCGFLTLDFQPEKKRASIMWYQQTLILAAQKRGFHLVTDEILGQMEHLFEMNIGVLHL